MLFTKILLVCPKFDRWEGVQSLTQMSQMVMPQSGYGGGVSDLIGTMSLNTVFFGRHPLYGQYIGKNRMKQA